MQNPTNLNYYHSPQFLRAVASLRQLFGEALDVVMRLSRLHLLFLAALAAPAHLALSADRPNFVLVMADDQGWGDMAYYGHPHLKTPHFDAFAREGIRFDWFYAAAPVCSPTRASVLTGRHPNRSGVPKHGRPLRPQEVTLPKILKQAGYRTGHFGKWHLGSVRTGSPVNPGAHGFDTWVSAENFFDLDPILSDRGRAVKRKGDSSDVTVDEALVFIREAAEANQPFLAVVWFASPHRPLEALPKDLKPYKELPVSDEQKHFYGEVTAMDRAFGRLRRELRELGLRDNTLLLYCSDNGGLPEVGSTGGAREYKRSIYDGGLRVPGLLEWPGRFQAPRVIDMPVSTSDIFPTVLDLAGLQGSPGRVLDGISLVPLLDGEVRERPQPIGFWDYPANSISVPTSLMDQLYAAQQEGREPDDPVRLHLDAATINETVPLDSFPGHAAWLDGSWKLHRIQDPRSDDVTWELYDLSADFAEQNNVLDAQPERAAAMRRDLETWLRSVARSYNGMEYTP